jgi:hypothetical protein
MHQTACFQLLHHVAILFESKNISQKRMFIEDSSVKLQTEKIFYH